jgi:hypothetical protein
VSKLAIDEFRLGSAGGKTGWRSPDYDQIEGRYDVEIGAGASKITVQNLRHLAASTPDHDPLDRGPAVRRGLAPVGQRAKPKRRRKAFRHKPCARRADRPEEGGGVRRKVRVKASVPNVDVERRGRWLQGSLAGILG